MTENTLARIEIKLAADGVDAGTGQFSGLGAVFGNVDSHNDVIAPGAFSATLKDWRKRGKFPPMLLQHGGMGVTADDMLPIGQWTAMEETPTGLKVTGQLFALTTERGQYIYEGLKSGALDGLSIGFRTKKFTLGTKPGEPRRTLEQVDLVEVSIVTWPSNAQARVASVKSAAEIDTRRKFERLLADAGFSRAAAAKLAAGGWPALAPDPNPATTDFARRLDEAAREIRAITKGH